MNGLTEDDALLLNRFLSACDTIASKFDGMLLGGEDGPARKRYSFYVAKFVKTFRAFALLVAEGYMEKAQILSRANFEVIVDMTLFSQTPRQNAQKVEEWLHASNWGLAPESSEEDAALKVAQVEYCRKYGCDSFPGHWSGMWKIKKRAKSAGLSVTYDTTYSIQSGLAHGDTMAFGSYLLFSSRPELDMRIGPDWLDAKFVIADGCWWVLYCLRCLEDGLNLRFYGLLPFLSRAIKDYSQRTRDQDPLGNPIAVKR